MKTRLISALAFTFALSLSVAFAVDSVDRTSNADQARVAAAVDRVESTLAADRAQAAAAVDRAAATTRAAVDRTEAALATERARVTTAADRAAADTGYAVDRAVATAEAEARNILPWIVGIALVAAFLYWAMRRSPTMYVPPVERVDRDVAVPPVQPRSATGTYNHP